MIGDVIKRERERRGWSQRDFAERVGLSQTYVSLLEKGERDNIGMDKLQAVARLFNMSLDRLVEESAEPTAFPYDALIAACLPEHEARRYQDLWQKFPAKRRALVESAERLAHEYQRLAELADEAHTPNGNGRQTPGQPRLVSG